MKINPFRLQWLLNIILLFSAISYFIYYQSGQFLHIESIVYLPSYLDNRDFLRKIFDIGINDRHCYQARELSYFFDWINAQFIAFCTRLGFPHFFELSHLLGTFFIAFLTLIFASNLNRRVPPILWGALSICFISSPVMSFSGGFFRSAKILTAVGWVLLFWVLFTLIIKERTISLRGNIQSTLKRESDYFFKRSLLGVLFFYSIVDRQAFFILLAGFALFVLLSLLYSTEEKKLYQSLVKIFALSILFNMFYNIILARSLILWIAGGWPKLNFQKMELHLLLKDPSIFRHSWELLLDQLSYFYGNFLPGKKYGVIILGILTGLFALKPKKTLPFWIMGVLFTFVLFCLMETKNRAQIWPEVRIVYYWIPTQVMLLTASVFAFLNIFDKLPRKWIAMSAYILSIGLFVLSAFNFAAFPRHKEVLLSGEQREQRLESPKLLSCIKNKSQEITEFQLMERNEHVCRFMRNLSL